VVIILLALYDLFEKDFFSDLLALTNIGKRISGKKDIHIEFNQNSLLTFTDGRFIYLPKKTKDDISSAQGLVAHESGHIGYGSFELSFIKLIDVFSKKYSLPQYFIKQVINVVEDVRINFLNDIKFPGFYKNLRAFTLHLLPDLIIRMKISGDLLIYINLYMENYKDFQEKPNFRTKNMSKEDWSVISTAKEFLLKSLTPASSIITIDQLCKVLRKVYVKKKISMNRVPLHKASSKAFYEPEYEDCCESDATRGFDESSEITEKLDYHSYLKDLQNSDFMEDPGLYDNIEEIKYPHNSPVDLEPLINHFEEFIERDGKLESSELSSASEKVIEKIKDLDLNTADIEKLIEEVERDTKTESMKGYLREAIKSNNFDLSKDFIKLIEANKELKILLENVENLKANKIEDLIAILINENQEDLPPQTCGSFISEIVKLVSDSQTALEGRLLLIENQDQFSGVKRKINDVLIENEDMRSIGLSYNEIVKTNNNIIAKLKHLFRGLRNQNDVDTFQKRGRLNNKFIKAVTSDFKYNKCFTRKLNQKELKILLMVDISGSMAGIKLEAAKIAMVMLCESLYEIAQLRIVLFTGEYDALNIQLKDFEESPDIKKFDKFGRHQRIGSNLDGVSLKHEAAKLEKNVLILVISDGQPAGTQYGLNDAIKEIRDVKKKFKVYAFSIDAKGDYLNKLYGNNWILTKSSDRTDLAEKLTQFCKFVVKEFFR
jgi:hypothetical protein